MKTIASHRIVSSTCLFIVLLSTWCAVGQAGAGEGKAARPQVEGATSRTPVGEGVVYKKVDGRELKLWIVKPADWKSTDQRPAVVFFHGGGGWVSGGPSQFNEQSRYLASRGMVCVQVQYRLLTKPNEPPTVCCRDARTSMRWVRSHAKELGINPDRIAAGGGSAGGHLAAFVGMVQGMDDPADNLAVSPRASALALFNPVFDNGPGGWGTARVGDRFPEFSPAHNVTPDDPPAIIFLGTQDKLIPVKTVEGFKDSLRKAGARCEAHFYEGQPHGFFNKEPWRTKTLIETDRFFASLGWLSGPPTLTEPDN